MFKTIAFLKRHPGMSLGDFKSHYEEIHAKIGEKYLRPHITRYVRRYLDPMVVDGVDMAYADDDYDVVTEIWYPDQEAFAAAVKQLALPGPAAEILADEEQLFDRARTRFYLVDERESPV